MFVLRPEINADFFLNFSLSYFFETEYLTAWSLFTNWTGCPVSPRELSGSACLCSGIIGYSTGSAFYMGAGNPNSNPYVCKASTLRIKPSPSPREENFSM